MSKPSTAPFPHLHTLEPLSLPTPSVWMLPSSFLPALLRDQCQRFPATSRQMLFRFKWSSRPLQRLVPNVSQGFQTPTPASSSRHHLRLASRPWAALPAHGPGSPSEKGTLPSNLMRTSRTACLPLPALSVCTTEAAFSQSCLPAYPDNMGHLQPLHLAGLQVTLPPPTQPPPLSSPTNYQCTHPSCPPCPEE